MSSTRSPSADFAGEEGTGGPVGHLALGWHRLTGDEAGLHVDGVGGELLTGQQCGHRRYGLGPHWLERVRGFHDVRGVAPDQVPGKGVAVEAVDLDLVGEAGLRDRPDHWWCELIPVSYT